MRTINASDQIIALLTTHIDNLNRLENDIKGIMNKERERVNDKIKALRDHYKRV